MAANRSAKRAHLWLSQVEVTGVVFSEPVLAEAEPTGFSRLEKKDLRAFHKAREIWNLPKEAVTEDGYPGWIRFVLEEILKLKRASDWRVGADIPAAWRLLLLPPCLAL